MSTSFCIFMISLLYSGYTLGSQFSGSVKVKSFQIIEGNKTIIEFENLERDNFSTLPANISKMKFDYLNWPKESRNRSFLEMLMFWKSKPEYRKEEFEQCISWMLENHKNDKSFQFGQVGGGTFEISYGAAIIPYLHFRKTEDGKEQMCLIDLG